MNNKLYKNVDHKTSTVITLIQMNACWPSLKSSISPQNQTTKEEYISSRHKHQRNKVYRLAIETDIHQRLYSTL